MYQQRLWFSFFWETKRRKPVLTGSIKQKLEQIIAEVAREKGFELGKHEIYPNGVYLELGLDPKTAPHSAICKIRYRAASVLRAHYPELKKIPSLWTRDYEVYGSKLDEGTIASLRRWLEDRRHRRLVARGDAIARNSAHNGQNHDERVQEHTARGLLRMRSC